jgi:hypothetical protein
VFRALLIYVVNLFIYFNSGHFPICCSLLGLSRPIIAGIIIAIFAAIFIAGSLAAILFMKRGGGKTYQNV